MACMEKKPFNNLSGNKIARLLSIGSNSESQELHKQHSLQSSSENIDREGLMAIAPQLKRYDIIEPLGEGGFGIVYLAAQSRPISRNVALKVLKPGMDSKAVITRFKAEQQALAIMDHPNVAKVFDTGTTPQGHPYFVMEYVPGIPITEYCDQCCLSIEERLELFIDVCKAIQHSHEKGIIHRDLKPSNILIAIKDDKPLVKVIDFGIAKAISQPLTKNTFFTNCGHFIGTPEYMSPEQLDINSDAIDIRSDIYSLGVLLYELLIGVLPYSDQLIRSKSFDEIKRIIREEHAVRPSSQLRIIGNKTTKIADNRQTNPEALLRCLRKELEWIPLKAMHKDTSQRYRSVAELHGDINSYLSGKPILAGPQSTSYLIKKFIERHRAIVITASIVCVAITIGIIGTILGFIEASRQRDATQQALELSERQAYCTTIQAARAKIQAHDFSQVRKMLEETKPSLRGWEWGYLMHLCDRPNWSLHTPLGNIIRGIAISPDEKYFLVSQIGAVSLWDYRTQKILWQKDIEVDPWPHCPLFNPKQQVVATISDWKITILNAEDGTIVFQSENRDFSAICFHPKDPLLYAGTNDGKLYTFDTTTWKIIDVREIHDSRVFLLSIGQSGKYLASTDSPFVYVFETESFKLVHKIKAIANEGSRGIVIFENKNLLVDVESTYTNIYSLDSAQLISQLKHHRNELFALIASRDERRIITASRNDGVINVYDSSQWPMNLDKETKPLKTLYHGDTVFSVDYASDETVLSADTKGKIHQWPISLSNDTPPENIEFPTNYTSGTYQLDYRSDGKIIATTGWNYERILLYNTMNRTIDYLDVEGLNSIGTNDKRSRLVQFKPHSNEIAVASLGYLRFYDTSKKGYPNTKNISLEKEIFDFRFDPTGSIIACSYVEGGIDLFYVSNGVPFRSFNVEYCLLAMSYDGRTLAALDHTECCIHVWDIHSGRKKNTIIQNFPDLRNSAIAFHPNNYILANSQINDKILLWDLHTNTLIKELHGHGFGGTTTLQFSKDGKRLLSSGIDRKMILWDWQLGKELMTFDQDWVIISASFSPDGLSIANTDHHPLAAHIRHAIPWK